MNTAESPQLPRIPKYDVVEEVGHGGMATVYRAVDQRLGREVAVKVIHRHLRESLEVGRRFTAEARAVAKLTHPNIVEIFDVSDEEIAERYLVAELVRGKSLRRVLEREGELPAEIAACVGVDLAAGLAHAHERGVVHRDVKPENVLFGFEHHPREDGAVTVKITDFGIAKLLDQQGVTSTGQVLGSPAYMAPEQIECGDVDARADVFSLGVLLYECMVGHLPFAGKNPAQVLRRVLDGAFSPADQERPTVGATWGAILARALAHAPADRFGGMPELERALTAELAALGIDDRAAELARFFADPAAYRAELASRLGPRLLARGKTALAGEDVVGAAACLNRALAFSPGDAVILGQVAKLTRRGQRRAALRGAGLGVAALATLGVVSFAALTFYRHRGVAPPPTPSAIVAPPPVLPDPSAQSSVAVVAPPASIATAAPPRIIAVPHVVADAGVLPAGERKVRFIVNPKSTLVSVDGGSAEQGAGLVKTLSVGVHRYSAFVGADNPCCNKIEPRVFEVQAAPDGASEQTVAVSLALKDATLISIGPASAQLRCPNLSVAGPGDATLRVRMNQLEDTADCSLFDGGREIERKTITVKAGIAITLTWHAPGAP